MYCDLSLRLTMRLMGLGYSLHEAERIAMAIMTGIVVVFTIMGFVLCPTCGNTPAGNGEYIPKSSSGIRPGIMGSQSCGSMDIAAGAGRRSSAFLIL